MYSVLAYYPKLTTTMVVLALPIAAILTYMDMELERKGRVDLPGKTQARAVEYEQEAERARSST